VRFVYLFVFRFPKLGILSARKQSGHSYLPLTPATAQLSETKTSLADCRRVRTIYYLSFYGLLGREIV